MRLVYYHFDFRQNMKDLRVDHWIDIVGIRTDIYGPFTVDRKFWLVWLDPTYTFALAHKKKSYPASLGEAVFYANCLSFEHELPTSVRQRRGARLDKPVARGRNRHLNESYYQAIGTAYESINDLRLGPLTTVTFQYQSIESTIDLPYTAKYARVSQELALYATALRQVDPLSEFLCYYRIIESVAGDNHKQWVERNLPRLSSYDFGFLRVFTDLVQPWERKRNLFTIYKRRAIARLHQLAQVRNRTDSQIAKYLYSENRCGIAHGKRDLKIFDFASTVEQISLDVYPMKLLARMAIEEKK